MLLRFIKSSDLLGLLLIPLTGILFWAGSLQNPGAMVMTGENTMPLYALLLSILKKSPMLQVCTGFLLVMANSFLITRIGSTFQLFKKGSRLTGVIYMLVVSSFKVLQNLHPVHIAALFILLAIFYIFNTYQMELEISYTFNASFLLAVASLFYFPVIILLPIIWISIFVLQRSDNWRILIIPLFGFIVPWIFVLAISFLSDSVRHLFTMLNGVIWAVNNQYLTDPFFLGLSVVMIFLVLMGSFTFLTTYPYIKVSSRKFFVVFYWMLALVGIAALSFTAIGIEIVALSTIPAAFLIPVFFLTGQRLFWKELIFLVLISALIIQYLKMANI